MMWTTCKQTTMILCTTGKVKQKHDSNGFNALCLSVCGLHNKLKYGEIQYMIEKHDLVVLTETKTDKIDSDIITDLFVSFKCF